MKFEIGDVVRLVGEKKSFTIVKTHGEENLTCVWLSVSGELQSADFPKGALKKIEGEGL